MSVRLDLEAVPLIDLTARPSEEKIPIKFENDTLNQDVARSVIQQTARDGKMSEAFHTALSQHPEAVNVADHLDGMTAVHFAAKYGHIDVLKVLFRFHGDVAVQNFEGDTPLHLVAKYCRRGLDGRTNITSQIIRMLVGQQTTNSKDKSYINCKDKFKLTALHYAAMKSNVQAAVTLISLGATVTETDSNDVTPLLLACVHGTKEVIEKLINAGSDLTKKDQRQNTVYHIVALRGEPEILRMLLQRAGKDGWSSLLLRNNEGKTPLRMAVEGNHPQTLKEILEIEQKNGTDWKTREKGLLHLAAGRGYLQVISELVQAGASKTEVDSRRQIPLHLAAKSNQKEVVEYLLEKETIDAVDDFGMTPLMVACAHDSIDALKILIESGANVWVFDNDDRTCVFVGAKYNALKTVDYILTYLKQQAAAKVGNEPAGKFFKTLRRVDTSGETSMVNMTDSDQSTPMHVVASNGYIEMMRLLYDHGAIISAVNEDEETPLHRAASVGETGAVRQLLEWDRRLILLKDDMGNSPLHLAAKRGSDVTTKLLLKEGADRDARNSYQQTPLAVAVEAGKLEVVQRLILNHATVESDSEIKTVLHLAAERGFHTIVQELLQHGRAQIDRRDEKGRTALEIAIQEGHRDVARVLVDSNDWPSLFVPNDLLPLGRHKDVRHTPLRRLIDKFPDIAAIVLDKCLEMSSPDSHEYMFAIAYNFELLDDTYMMPDDKGTSLVGYKKPFDDEFRLKKEARAYTDDYDVVYKNHPLKMMANAERLSLLSHPVCVALLKHKWNALGRYVYYFALSIYILFITFLTIYVTHTPAPYNVPHDNQLIDLTERFSEDSASCPDIQINQPNPVFKVTVIVLAAAHIIKEVFQLFQRRISYVNWENLLECFIYSSAIVTVLDFTECSASSGIKMRWQWLLAAVCTFTAWMNLLLMIRKLPRFGIYVVMFFDIVRTFSRFFIIFLLFIVAFSTSFYVIMQNRPEFSTMGSSLLKTTVMMIGEFEFTAIFHGDAMSHSEKLFGHAVAYPLFFFFCVIMTILLMNLLVGLAVDDIKSVQEKAELKRLIMQVDLVLQVEASMPYIRRIVTRSRYSFFPNQHGLMKRIRNRFGFDSSSEMLLSEVTSSETEFATLMRTSLLLQKAQLQTLQENVDVMYEKQVKLESMLKRLAKGLNVELAEEEDVS